MDFTSKLLFFFGALGAFNGLIIASYFLFFEKLGYHSNKFFGLFLLMLSIRTWKSVYYYYTEDLPDFFLMLALIAFFFIGPFLLFFLQSVLKIKSDYITSRRTHLLILVPIVILLSSIYTFSGNPLVWRNLIVDFIYLEWFLYSIFSFFLVFPLIKKIVKKDKGNYYEHEIRALTVFFINIIALTGSLVGHFTVYIIGALTFSLIVYIYLGVMVLTKRRKLKTIGKSWLNPRNSLSSQDVRSLIHELQIVMEKDELFLDPTLKSSEVAEKLNISINQLSELVNVHLSKNFSTLVNEYRVQHAKSIMNSRPNYTLEAIGYESGFNSKSTFYKSFKKITGTSPSKYYNYKYCAKK